MWAQCQTLADLRLYMYLSEDSDEIKQIQVFITRCFLDERKYVEEFYPEYTNQISEDDTSRVSDSNLDFTTSEVSSIALEDSVIDQETLETDLRSDQNKLSKRLSTLGLNNFDLSSSGDSDIGDLSGAVGGVGEDINSKEDRLQRYLEGAAVLAQNPVSGRQSVENSIAEDQDSDRLSVGNSIDDLESDSCRQSIENNGEELDEWESNSMAELMKTMGLPTSFGVPQKKTKKRQLKVKNKMSDKEIRKLFAAFWDDQGELIVYRSFVLSYPDYAGYYDQITGSIPPGVEMEVSTQAQDNPTAPQDMPKNDLNNDIVTSTSDTNENCAKCDQSEPASVLEKNRISLNGSNHEIVMNGDVDMDHHQHNVDKNGDSVFLGSGDASNTKEMMVNAGQSFITPDTTVCLDFDLSGEKGGQATLVNNTESAPAVSHDTIRGEHGYVAVSSSADPFPQCNKDQKGSSEEGYNHEDLIAMLKELHYDMQNNIRWYVKNKFEEWTREHPDSDFDISILDNHLLAQNEDYAYATNQGDGFDPLQEGPICSPSRNSVIEDEDLVSEKASGLKKSIPETLELLGLTVNMDPEEREKTKRRIHHGTIIYKRKSIRREAKRLKLDYGRIPKAVPAPKPVPEPKPEPPPMPVPLPKVLPDVLRARHIIFDDDGVPHVYGKQPLRSSKKNDKIDPPELSIPAEIGQEEVDNQIYQDTSQSSSSSCYTSEAGDEASNSVEMTTTTGQKRRRPKNHKRKAGHSEQRRKNPHDLSEHPVLAKYWYQRYHLFKRFDEGIRLDHESWFSVTPELVASHIAERCRCDTIIDGFCGAGGNAIQFAFTCYHVIAIDIDATKLELARHNANIYGVADRITFIQGDFNKLAPTLKADVVFLSPPWGGPEYVNSQVYNIDSMAGFMAAALLKTARQISDNIAFYIPRNADIEKVFALAEIEGGRVEIEENFLHTRLKTLTAYFGELLNFS